MGGGVWNIYIYITFLFQSQKLNSQVIRLLIFMLPAVGLVHPTCRLGTLDQVGLHQLR